MLSSLTWWSRTSCYSISEYVWCSEGYSCYIQEISSFLLLLCFLFLGGGFLCKKWKGNAEEEKLLVSCLLFLYDIVYWTWQMPKIKTVKKENTLVKWSCQCENRQPTFPNMWSIRGGVLHISCPQAYILISFFMLFSIAFSLTFSLYLLKSHTCNFYAITEIQNI